MSLKKNIIANYLSQFYVALIGIAMVPLYIGYMGAEAYGLVGFFTMAQAWFSILDMGLTPTLTRETARHRGGASSDVNFLRLVWILEIFFLVVGTIAGLVLFAAAGMIATDWLKASQLPVAQVQQSVQLMAVALALRWMAGLYRGMVSGAERLVWLSGFNATVASIRFLAVLPVLIFVSPNPTVFFQYQLGVALIELAVLTFFARALLPVVAAGRQVAWDWAALRPVIRFSLTIALSGAIWVLVTQTDKLVLSKLMPLADYGYYSMAVLAAGGVLLISAPVSAAIMPRLANLEAQGDHAGLIRQYRQATQFVAVMAGAACATMAYCAEPLLTAWTGDGELARRVAPVFVLYVIGNGVFTAAAFAYYLQFAKGDLRLHLLGNLVFVFLLVPTIIWASRAYGGIGAGYVWLGVNLLSLFAWIPLVHRKFEPGLNRQWYWHDTTAIYLAMAAAGLLLRVAQPVVHGRLGQVMLVVGFGLAMLAVGSLASSFVRGRLVGFVSRQIGSA